MKRSVIIFPDRAGQLACQWAGTSPSPPLPVALMYHCGTLGMQRALTLLSQNPAIGTQESTDVSTKARHHMPMMTMEKMVIFLILAENIR